jgi:hypothetical protein
MERKIVFAFFGWPGAEQRHPFWLAPGTEQFLAPQMGAQTLLYFTVSLQARLN